MITTKCVFVGNSGVGKTMLLNSFLGYKGRKPFPTTVDNYVFYNGNTQLSIWDIGGNSTHRKLRFSYFATPSTTPSLSEHSHNGTKR